MATDQMDTIAVPGGSTNAPAAAAQPTYTDPSGYFARFQKKQRLGKVPTLDATQKLGSATARLGNVSKFFSGGDISKGLEKYYKGALKGYYDYDQEQIRNLMATNMPEALRGTFADQWQLQFPNEEMPEAGPAGPTPPSGPTDVPQTQTTTDILLGQGVPPVIANATKGDDEAMGALINMAYANSMLGQQNKTQGIETLGTIFDDPLYGQMQDMAQGEMADPYTFNDQNMASILGAYQGKSSDIFEGDRERTLQQIGLRGIDPNSGIAQAMIAKGGMEAGEREADFSAGLQERKAFQDKADIERALRLGGSALATTRGVHQDMSNILNNFASGSQLNMPWDLPGTVDFMKNPDKYLGDGGSDLGQYGAMIGGGGQAATGIADLVTSLK